MRNYKKIITISLAIITALSCIVPASAGEPGLIYDEALYIKMDPYGLASQMSVVKSYSPNGNKQIVDYGDYDEIINMSDYTVPKKEDGKVEFNFTQVPNRFYFEGKTTKLKTVLPWKIDIGYKLNGVPVKAESLVGAKGLVEITVNVTPNKNASEYFKNNMILQMATMVDIDKHLSVEAPGAQIQSVGNYKTVIFFALPGEEQEFTIKIGSDDFSFSGLAFMMVPGTLAQLEDIKKLRENKEDIEDSVDAINASLDVILNTLSGMQSSFSEAAGGLTSLQEARQIVSDSKGDVYANADEALNKLSELSKAMEPYDGHLIKASKVLNEINTYSNDANTNLKDIKQQLIELNSVLESIKKDTESFSEQFATYRKDEKYWKQELNNLERDLNDLNNSFQSLNNSVDYLHNNLYSLNNSLVNLNKDGLEDLSAALLNSKDLNSMGVGATVGAINELVNMAPTMGDALLNINRITGAITSNTTHDYNLVYDLKQITNLIQKAVDNTIDHSEDAQDMIDSLAEASEIAININTSATKMIDNINSISDTLSENHQDAIQTIEDTRILSNTASQGLSALHMFSTSLKAQLQSAGGKADDGTKASLNGLIATLKQSISGLAQTGTIKSSKDTIKNLIDDKWDEYTGEKNNILNMDSSAKPISFTSEKNESPQSIQIILRTEEIKADDDDDAIDVDESFRAEGNFLTRIGSIFKEIWRLISSLWN